MQIILTVYCVICFQWMQFKIIIKKTWTQTQKKENNMHGSTKVGYVGCR